MFYKLCVSKLTSLIRVQNQFFGIAFVLDNAFSSVRTARELVIKELFSLATTLLSYKSIMEQL